MANATLGGLKIKGMTWRTRDGLHEAVIARVDGRKLVLGAPTIAEVWALLEDLFREAQ